MNFVKRLAVRLSIATLSGESRELIRFLQKRGIAGAVFPTDYGNLAIPVNSRSIIESFMEGEYFGSRALQSFLDCDGGARRLLNIGANVGTSARFIASSRKYARIDCFEPDLGNFAFLRMNAMDSPALVLHNTALGAEEGELFLNLNPRSVGRHSFKTDFGCGAVKVPVRRIDDYLDSNEAFDIFMDVEGWEVEVLRGASASLRNCRLCGMEWNGHLHDHGEKLAMMEIVEAAGFTRVADLNDLGVPISMDDVLRFEDQRDIVFGR